MWQSFFACFFHCFHNRSGRGTDKSLKNWKSKYSCREDRTQAVVAQSNSKNIPTPAAEFPRYRHSQPYRQLCNLVVANVAFMQIVMLLVSHWVLRRLPSYLLTLQPLVEENFSPCCLSKEITAKLGIKVFRFL